MKSYAPVFPGTAPDFQMGGTGLSGLALSDTNHWPHPYDNVFYIANPITRKIQAIRLHEDGPRYRLEHLPDFVHSSDEFFRPVAITVGPDGNLYIVDWYNKIISHNEVPRNHPERDKTRGQHATQTVTTLQKTGGHVLGVILNRTRKTGTAYYAYEAYSIVSNRWVDPTAVASSVQEQLKSGWHSSLAEGLAVAKREKKPVLIDAWATWCKNCLTMDKTTLASEDVKRALSGYVKIKFQAEDPDAEPANHILQRMSAAGLPAYAILKPK